jgi:nucleotide-binding universal stress UspA family protein
MIYATDLSPDSIDALRYAVNYANQHNAKLIVFHVINQRSITCSKILATFFNETQEYKIVKEKSHTALKRMKNLMEIIRKMNPNDQHTDLKNVEYLLVHYGRIVEEIIEKANRWGCELIILGPRRKGLLGRTLLPSVARSIIRRTGRPVHIIKLQK